MIRLKGVHKRFQYPVLDGVDLEVPAGCLFGLIGPGASGKSVLLKVICGLVAPESGEVEVAGRRLAELDDEVMAEHRRGIGMLFQNNALFDFMTVGENIAFPLRRLFPVSDAEVRERVAERLLRVGLSGFEDRLVRGLSGGQKKRIGIARATITRAPLLLYDEPAAGLDPVTSQRIFELLADERRASGASAVMVSSDLERLLTVIDRVAMMHRGRIVFEGTPDEARNTRDPLVRQFVWGLPDGPL